MRLTGAVRYAEKIKTPNNVNSIYKVRSLAFILTSFIFLPAVADPVCLDLICILAPQLRIIACRASSAAQVQPSARASLAAGCSSVCVQAQVDESAKEGDVYAEKGGRDGEGGTTGRCAVAADAGCAEGQGCKEVRDCWFVRLLSMGMAF